MTDPLNISTMPIADKVQRHMMASYYVLQLDALQAEAKRLGYFFAQCDDAAYMPPLLVDRLARAVEYRRTSCMNPDAAVFWDQWTDDKMRDGYAQEHMRCLFAALTALGLRLQETSEAASLLAEEELRLPETFQMPQHCKESPDSLVSEIVSEFFDKTSSHNRDNE